MRRWFGCVTFAMMCLSRLFTLSCHCSFGFCQLDLLLDVVVRSGEPNLTSTTLLVERRSLFIFSSLRSMCIQCWLTKNFVLVGV